MRVPAIVIASSLLLAVASAQGQGVNDAQIASIVVTANQVDIDAGKLAAISRPTPKSRSSRERMITDHTGVNKSATDLVTKLKVTPQDNPTSQSLKSGGDENLANLKSARRAPRSTRPTSTTKSPITSRCSMRSTRRSFPSAKNEELKALLVKVRPAFVAHLEHAKMIQSSMGAPAGSMGKK